MGLRQMESRLPPGFRFCPSDDELVCFYLRKKVANERVASGTLVEVDLHAGEPWELPEVAKLTADEWYFFSLRDRKYAKGSRTNRATKTGYWKATGRDRAVQDVATHATVVGMRKTLVFYTGRAPNGHKTGWVMHEFRLEAPGSLPKEDWVLCRVFNKAKASQTEQGGNISTNHAIITGSTGTGPSSPTTVSLGSSPDPSVVDKFDGGHQLIGTAAAMSSSSISDTSLQLMHGDRHMGGSSYATLDLTMLPYYSLLEEYCTNPAMHDDMMAVGASHTGCCSAGSDRNSNDGMLELDLGLGHVGFGDHGMGEIEIEMEMEMVIMQGGGSCYRDGSYI